MVMQPDPANDETAILIARLHELAACVGKVFTPDPVKVANFRRWTAARAAAAKETNHAD